MSVVKELVENAIDAGSTRIVVDIAEGGFKQILVSDDGCGMSADDLRLAVLRHATSKIKRFDDLEEIKTNGFRGEALPSIGAVSHMEILSCSEGSMEGNRIHLEGGSVSEPVSAASEQGTRIKVTRLFYNTPARKKFQKSPSQETALISQYLSGCAAAHCHIHFTLKNNGKIIFDYPRQLTRKDRLVHMWNLPGNVLLPFSGSDREMSVEGYAVDPEHVRSNRTEILVFVNRRPVKSPLIYQAVQEGYHPFLPQRKFPYVFLSLEIDGREVDVNVHPSKTEIRFTQGGSVFRLIRDSVAAAVKTFHPAPSEVIEQPVETHRPYTGASHQKPYQHYQQPRITREEVAASLLFYNPSTGEIAEERKDEPGFEPLVPHTVEMPSVSPGFVPLAQLYDTYIIGRKDNELWLLDQHASHERIVYERLRKGKSERTSSSQGLLFPEVIELSPAEAHLMNELIGPCAEMGIEIEPFGGSSFMLRSIPSFIRTDDAKNLVGQLISDLMAESHGSPEDRADRLRKIMACRGSIQAGDRLMPREMERLVSGLLQADDPHHCPHGRPTMIRMAQGDFERLFKRR